MWRVGRDGRTDLPHREGVREDFFFHLLRGFEGVARGLDEKKLTFVLFFFFIPKYF